MMHRHRALTALVLATVLTAGSVAVAGAHDDSRIRTRTIERSERSERGSGFLGVNLQDLSEGLAESYDYDGRGVVVSSVVRGSPADRAGVREGDIITRFNGSSVRSADQLTRRVRGLSPGTLADLTVWRDGKERDLERVEIGNLADSDGNDRERTRRVRREVIRDHDDDDAEAPVAPRAPRSPRRVRTPAPPPPGQTWNMEPGDGMSMMGGRGRLGIEMRDLDDDLGEYFDSQDGKGVLVLRVFDDTPARRAGLKAGDVILSIDGKDVGNGEELRKEVRAAKAGSIELRIRRRGVERTIEATLGRAEQGLMGGEGRNWMGWNHGDSFEMLSKEDKAKLRKDLEKLREDLREMHRDRRDGDRRDDRDD